MAKQNALQILHGHRMALPAPAIRRICTGKTVVFVAGRIVRGRLFARSSTRCFLLPYFLFVVGVCNEREANSNGQYGVNTRQWRDNKINRKKKNIVSLWYNYKWWSKYKCLYKHGGVDYIVCNCVRKFQRCDDHVKSIVVIHNESFHTITHKRTCPQLKTTQLWVESVPFQPNFVTQLDTVALVCTRKSMGPCKMWRNWTFWRYCRWKKTKFSSPFCKSI